MQPSFNQMREACEVGKRVCSGLPQKDTSLGPVHIPGTQSSVRTFKNVSCLNEFAQGPLVKFLLLRWVTGRPRQAPTI